MLNLGDIKDRLRRFPEPPEVGEIRDSIRERFRRLEFQEGPHKYFVHEDDGTVDELPSVSSICASFEVQEDWDAIAMRYAEKNGRDVESVKREWHETNILATNNGTSTHLYGEMMMHFFQGHPERICDVVRPQYEDEYLIPYSPKQMAAMRYFEDLHRTFYDDSLKSHMYPVMPESQIYIFRDNQFGIKKRYSGTFDILNAFRAKDGRWKLCIDDYKTNGSLVNEFNRSHGKMMLPPFEDFVEEPLSHYTIQQSCYSIGLMQLGYEIAGRRLIWLKDDGTYEKVPVQDVTDRLLKVL